MNADFERILKQDKLKFLRIISVDIFFNKPVRVVCWFALVIHALVTVLNTYYYLKIFDLRFLVQYGPIYFGTFFIIFSSVISLLYLVDVTYFVIRETGLTALDTNDSKISSQIENQSKFLKGFTIASTFIAICSGLAFTYHHSIDADLFFAVFFIRENFSSKWGPIVTWVYKISFLSAPFVMLAPIYTFIYLTTQAKFKVWLVSKLLNEIKEFGDDQEMIKDWTSLVGDDYYQRNIRKKLINFTTNSDNILSTGRRTADKLRFIYVLYTVLTIILGIDVVLYVIMFPELLSDKVVLFRSTTITISVASMFIVVIYNGQQIENLTERLYDDICNLNWYNWNKENKTIYSIILSVLTIEPFKLQLSTELSINYELGVSMSKTVYSMLSVLKEMRGVQAQT